MGPETNILIDFLENLDNVVNPYSIVQYNCHSACGLPMNIIHTYTYTGKITTNSMRCMTSLINGHPSMAYSYVEEALLTWPTAINQMW